MTKHSDKRTFIAISLSQQHTNTLVKLQQYLRPYIDKNSVPVDKQNLHITTAFLGRTSEQQIQQVIEYINQQKLASFEQELDQYAWWPAAKVVCVEGKEGAEIKRIANTLQQMNAQLGLYQTQHKFRPHISLFRSVNQVNPEFNNLTPPIVSICIKASELTLYESINSSQRVTYNTLQRWPLDP